MKLTRKWKDKDILVEKKKINGGVMRKRGRVPVPKYRFTAQHGLVPSKTTEQYTYYEAGPRTQCGSWSN